MLENTATPEVKIITTKTKDNIDKSKDTTDNTKDSTDNTKNTADNTKDIITLPKTIIEKHKSELDETIKNIQIIFESFACEKFMNENFNVRSYNKKDHEISMWSINKLEKDAITLNNIKLCDDMILLETQKEMENMVEDRKLFIDEELISLQPTQIKDNGIKSELNILITILITTSIKDITSEITLIEKDDIANTVVNEFKCSNKIRYMIITKIMYWLVKLCRKKDDMVNNNSTSKTKDSTSKTNTSTPNKPKTNTSTPKTNTSTPKTNTSTPKTNTSTPKTNTSTPKTNTSTPKTNTSTPKTNTSTPKTNTSTPKTNTSTPKTNTSTPKTNTSTPKTNTSTPKTNTSIPKTNASIPTTNDRVDIENHRSELHKIINNIKTILDSFVCEKFMNEKLITRNLNKDGILLCSINNSMKGIKIINTIAIYRDLISLIREKNTKAMKQDITIYA